MMVIRPIESRDLNDLVGLAEGAGVGVTTLPANPELLESRIVKSIRSFQCSQPKDHGNYVFALEDTTQSKVVGVSAIDANIGRDEVWYNYRISKVVHASNEIGVHTTNQMLELSNDLTGVSELCTLFLEATARTGNNGRLLSKCRMLFLAEFQDYFDEKIIAEMRGYSDQDGISPFWESLGKKFFQMDFSSADYQVGVGNKNLVAELMPRYPIYLFFLSPEAKAVIAKTHDNTRPALEMLKKEGFHFNGYIDIFDAGPVVECFVEEIRAVRESKVKPAIFDSSAVRVDDQRSDYVVSNQSLESFRAILVGEEQIGTEGVRLNQEQLAALSIESGHTVRYVPLRY